MRDGSVAECAVNCAAPGFAMERKDSRVILRMKAIPWASVILDTLLLLGFLAASSSFLLQR